MLAMLTAMAITLVSPYLAKAGEAFAGKAGEAVFDLTSQLWGKLAVAFGKDPESKAVADRFAADPKANEAEMSAALAAQLAANSALRDDIGALLERIRNVGADVKVVQEAEKAGSMVGVRAGTIRDGKTLDIRQKAGDVTEMTGLDVGDL